MRVTFVTPGTISNDHVIRCYNILINATYFLKHSPIIPYRGNWQLMETILWENNTCHLKCHTSSIKSSTLNYFVNFFSCQLIMQCCIIIAVLSEMHMRCFNINTGINWRNTFVFFIKNYPEFLNLITSKLMIWKDVF